MPDVIYHMGDFGKEPMIIVFGKTPNDVLEKRIAITPEIAKKYISFENNIYVVLSLKDIAKDIDVKPTRFY